MHTQALRILLVEDHPFQLIAMQVLLNNHGMYLLTPALTATEAMIAMENSAEPYDLLLCDQCLPDISGLELIEIAARHGLIRRAVLLSGIADQQLQELERIAHDRGLPLLGCLSKPLDALALRQLISQEKSDR